MALTRIIEKTRRERTPVLDLSKAGLTSLPLEVCGLTHLTELNLGNVENGGTNSLTELPPEIEALQNLRTLRVGMNQLRTVPAQIGQLKALEWVYGTTLPSAASHARSAFFTSSKSSI
jgi:Leucine-rich repeat (LRR) protein